ncbi:PLP-dependent aminotransferase family protein [Bordetella tumulicola]|uniref:MocR-like pyridoxine biosynthesis transcription factor PdxR n=1 Tax=Bordetella tumulicola TaxID=1649133 RepID=UPI0039EFCC75
MREVILSEFLLQKLERKGATSLARQLYDVLRQLILAGDLGAGTKLPASRVLAKETALSRNTVLGAYEQLQSEGYVVSTTGSGTFVSDTVPSLPLRHSDRTDVAAVVPAHLALSRRGADLVRNAQASSVQWGAFTPGVPDVSLFPHEIWSRLTRRRWRKPDPALLTYSHGPGYLPLRTALAQHLRFARSVDCEPDQVIVTNGVHQSLSLIAGLLGDSNEVAWIENPAYWGARTVLKANGLRVQPIHVDDEGMAPSEEQMQTPPRFMFVTPSHQYPLGTVMSLSRRRMLLEYAHRNNSWIIEDDYDSEFRYDGRPIASLQGLDSNERVIYLGTFSKTLFPGLRLSFMVVPRVLSVHFGTGLSELYREGRLIDQAVLADFMNDGHYASHIRRMRTQYARRQTLLRDAILAQFGGGWPISTHEAGQHLVMHLPEGTDDVGIVLAARSLGISLRPLSRYYAGGGGRAGLVLGYACVPDDVIGPAFQKLVPAIVPALEHVSRSRQQPRKSSNMINEGAWSGA